MALDRVTLLHGPDVPCHRPSLQAWCSAQALEWGIAVELVACDASDALLRELDAALSDGRGVVLAPGALAGDPAVQRHAAALARADAHAPLVWLALELALGPAPDVLAAAGVQTIRGRGVDGHRWALRSLLERAAWPVTSHRYGDGPDLVADLRMPAPAAGAGDEPAAVVVLLHGGAWRVQWERDLMDPLAVDLARRGYATWNVEYRRTGAGGGWPQTFEDVAAAIDALGALAAPLNLARVALLGHSAGGQLALWAAARDRRPGPPPTVHPAFVLALAGLPDMVDTAQRGTYERAAEPLLGGLPDAVPERYAQISPHALLPLGVPQLLVHGTADQPDNVDMNRSYAERATAAGDAVELLELPGVEHFAPIEPRSAAWRQIAARLQERFPA